MELVHSSNDEMRVEQIMLPAVAVFSGTQTTAEATEQIRELAKSHMVTYGFVVDCNNKLEGLFAMRDILLANSQDKLEQFMIKNPFQLINSMSVLEAMRATVSKHFPVYPVCDAEGKLLGEVRGSKLFEAQAFELSAQAGSMVGVEKEERVTTAWTKSFKFRHPWLQLNLLTAFVAGAVVSIFQGTIDKYVILASFLPILAGQSGNTGCQALAVTLRGMTLGDLEKAGTSRLVSKEAFLGLLNGFFVGLIAGGAMYFLADSHGDENSLVLGSIVLVSMVFSCAISGLSGALIPQILKKLGADPATASSIFLTTATDVASMGLLLGLATMIL
jgi:magnesium transporter